MKIEEVQSTTKKQRVATHTHIKVCGDQISRRRSGTRPPIRPFDFSRATTADRIRACVR